MEPNGNRLQAPPSNDVRTDVTTKINNQTIPSFDKDLQHDWPSDSFPEHVEGSDTSEDTAAKISNAWQSNMPDVATHLLQFQEFHQSPSFAEPSVINSNEYGSQYLGEPTSPPSHQIITQEISAETLSSQQTDSMNSQQKYVEHLIPTQHAFLSTLKSTQETFADTPESDQQKYDKTVEQTYAGASHSIQQICMEPQSSAQQTYFNTVDAALAGTSNSAEKNFLAPPESDQQIFVEASKSIQPTYVNSPFSAEHTYVDILHSLQPTHLEAPHSSQLNYGGTKEFLPQISNNTVSCSQQQSANTSRYDQQSNIESCHSAGLLCGEIPTFHQELSQAAEYRKRYLLVEEMRDVIDDKLLCDVTKQLLEPSAYNLRTCPLRRVLLLWGLDHFGFSAPRQLAMEEVMDELLFMLESKEILARTSCEALRPTGVRLLLDVLDEALSPDPVLMHQAFQGDSMAQAFSHAHATILGTRRGYAEVLGIGRYRGVNDVGEGDSQKFQSDESYHNDDESGQFAEEATGTTKGFENEDGVMFGGVGSSSVFGNVGYTDGSRNVFGTQNTHEFNFENPKGELKATTQGEFVDAGDGTFRDASGVQSGSADRAEHGATRWRQERYDSVSGGRTGDNRDANPCICTDGPCMSCIRCYPPLRTPMSHPRRRPYANERKEPKRKLDLRPMRATAWPDSDVPRSDTSSPEDIPSSSTSSVKGVRAYSISIASDPQSNISSDRERNISGNFSSTEPQSSSSYSGTEGRESSKSLDSDKSGTIASVTENQIQSSLGSENENISYNSGSEAQSSSIYSESDQRCLIDSSESSESRLCSTFSSSDQHCSRNESESERYITSSSDADHNLVQSDAAPRSEQSEQETHCISPPKQQGIPFTDQERIVSNHEKTQDSSVNSSFELNICSTQNDQSVNCSYFPIQSFMQQYLSAQYFSGPQMNYTNALSESELHQLLLQYQFTSSLHDQSCPASESATGFYLSGSNASQLLHSESATMPLTYGYPFSQHGELSQEQFEYFRDVCAFSPEYFNILFANQMQDPLTFTSPFQLPDIYCDSHSQCPTISDSNFHPPPHPCCLTSAYFYSTGCADTHFQNSSALCIEQPQYSETFSFQPQEFNDSSESQIHLFNTSSADISKQTSLEQYSMCLSASQSVYMDGSLDHLEPSETSSVLQQDNITESQPTFVQGSIGQPAPQPQFLDNISATEHLGINDSCHVPLLEVQNHQSDASLTDSHIHESQNKQEQSESLIHYLGGPSMPLAGYADNAQCSNTPSIVNFSEVQPLRVDSSPEGELQNDDESPRSPPEDTDNSRTSPETESQQYSASLAELHRSITASLEELQRSIASSLEELQLSGMASPPELQNSGPALADSPPELQYSIPPSVHDIWDDGFLLNFRTDEIDLQSENAWYGMFGMVSSGSSTFHPGWTLANYQGQTSTSAWDHLPATLQHAPQTHMPPFTPANEPLCLSEDHSFLESSNPDTAPDQSEQNEDDSQNQDQSGGFYNPFTCRTILGDANNFLEVLREK